jgi:hypothetical protein
MEMQQQCQQGMQAQPLALVCVTKEVLLPRELQDASESLQMILCEDMLQAFQVSFFSCYQASLIGVLLKYAV